MGDKHLIELIKPYEVLYNSNSAQYRDATLRKDAWNNISKAHGKPIDQCKEIWNRLRNCYTNSIKRRLKKSDKVFTPWRFEEEMSFVKPYLASHILKDLETDKEHNYNNDTFDTNEACDNDDNDYSPDAMIYAECKQSPQSIHDTENSDTETPTHNPFKRMANTSTSNAHITDVLENIMKQTQENRSILEMDDLDTFFLSISKTVKKLPKPEQVKIKMNLLKAVSEAELKVESKVNHKY